MWQALFQAPETQQWISEQNMSDCSSPEAYILEWGVKREETGDSKKDK